MSKTEKEREDSMKKTKSKSTKQQWKGITETKLHIDHNHSTGKVRHLLCKECNMALGLLQENVGSLKNMIEYLEKDRNAT